MARFLMCSPEYFDIEYEINPWMRLSVQVDRALAMAQWQELYQVLTQELGTTVELLSPRKGLPDLVFTANAGYAHGDLFVSSSFRHPQRQGETPLFEAWFQALGYRIHKMPQGCPFEGAGDALPLGDTILAGYRHRSEVCSHEELAGVTGCRVLSLELVDPSFYHLDTCLCPLQGGTALYYPKAFDSYAIQVLADNVPDLVPVSDASARQFACNAVLVGDTVVLNTGCGDMEPALERRGYRVRAVNLSEFMKSGGSAKCLTLRLDQEL